MAIKFDSGGRENGNRWRTSPELWEKVKPIARQMRKEPTEAEKVLWSRLRRRQLLGYRFRRQHTIERFIVDFYCAEASLVLEVDGPVHQYTTEEDRIRQAYIELKACASYVFQMTLFLNILMKYYIGF